MKKKIPNYLGARPPRKPLPSRDWRWIAPAFLMLATAMGTFTVTLLILWVAGVW